MEPEGSKAVPPRAAQRKKKKGRNNSDSDRSTKTSSGSKEKKQESESESEEDWKRHIREAVVSEYAACCYVISVPRIRVLRNSDQWMRCTRSFCPIGYIASSTGSTQEKIVAREW